MGIPEFTINGVLPPFLGPFGPGGSSGNMSPYGVTSLQVVKHFGTSENRLKLLIGWLNHRKQLRSLGFRRGFQWLDGSFVEDKEPKDIDLVTFVATSDLRLTDAEREVFLNVNMNVFDPQDTLKDYGIESFPVDLSDDGEDLVDVSRYWLNLFSHQRKTEIWKGMLKIKLDTTGDDEKAIVWLLDQQQDT